MHAKYVNYHPLLVVTHQGSMIATGYVLVMLSQINVGYALVAIQVVSHQYQMPVVSGSGTL